MSVSLSRPDGDNQNMRAGYLSFLVDVAEEIFPVPIEWGSWGYDGLGEWTDNDAVLFAWVLEKALEQRPEYFEGQYSGVLSRDTLGFVPDLKAENEAQRVKRLIEYLKRGAFRAEP